MSLFRKKSSSANTTPNSKLPKPSKSSPFQDPTASSPSATTMSTSRSSPQMMRPSESTSSSTSSLIPRPRKPSLKGMFSSGSLRRVSQGKVSKHDLGGDPTRGGGDLDLATGEAAERTGSGGGIGGWLLRRRSKDVLGYEGAGFAGAVPEGVPGEEGGGMGRTRRGSTSGRGSISSLTRRISGGGENVVKEEREDEVPPAVVGKFREEVESTNPSLASVFAPTPDTQHVPPAHPFSPEFSSQRHSPALGPPLPPSPGASAAARSPASLASPAMPQTPPQLRPDHLRGSPDLRQQDASPSSRSSSPSKVSNPSEADRMRRASLLSLFSGSTRSKTGQDGSSGRASVEVDRRSIEPVTGTREDAPVRGRREEESGRLAGEGRGSRSSSASSGGPRPWLYQANRLHTGESSPSSLQAALPTPSPYGHPSFMPTSPTFQQPAGTSQPLPPVVSTSISVGPSTADLSAAPEAGPSTASLPPTPAQGSAASASEALLHTIALQSASTPRVKLKKKNSLGSSPAGRVRKKKAEGETDSRGSSRRGSLDIRRAELEELPPPEVVSVEVPTSSEEEQSSVGGEPAASETEDVASSQRGPGTPSEALTAPESQPSPSPVEPAQEAIEEVPTVDEVTQDEAESSLLSRDFEEAATGGATPPALDEAGPARASTPSEGSTTGAAASTSPVAEEKKHTHLGPHPVSAPDPDDSLHPAPLTFFDPDPKPAQLHPSAKRTRTRTRSRSSGPATTPQINSSYLTYRLPNPLHPFLPLLSIPLSFAPEKVGQVVRQDRVVLDLRGVLGVEQVVGAVGTVGTVLKWGVGWWVIIPYRVVNGVVGGVQGVLKGRGRK